MLFVKNINESCQKGMKFLIAIYYLGNVVGELWEIKSYQSVHFFQNKEKKEKLPGSNNDNLWVEVNNVVCVLPQ